MKIIHEKPPSPQKAYNKFFCRKGEAVINRFLYNGELSNGCNLIIPLVDDALNILEGHECHVIYSLLPPFPKAIKDASTSLLL
jgi:hypothetical protein